VDGCALIAPASDNMLQLGFQPLISSSLLDFLKQRVSYCHIASTLEAGFKLSRPIKVSVVCGTERTLLLGLLCRSDVRDPGHQRCRNKLD
jgi:hypothetical protein